LRHSTILVTLLLMACTLVPSSALTVQQVWRTVQQELDIVQRRIESIDLWSSLAVTEAEKQGLQKAVELNKAQELYLQGVMQNPGQLRSAEEFSKYKARVREYHYRCAYRDYRELEEIQPQLQAYTQQYLTLASGLPESEFSEDELSKCLASISETIDARCSDSVGHQFQQVVRTPEEQELLRKQEYLNYQARDYVESFMSSPGSLMNPGEIEDFRDALLEYDYRFRKQDYRSFDEIREDLRAFVMVYSDIDGVERRFQNSTFNHRR
jgi:regulator of sigma D